MNKLSVKQRIEALERQVADLQAARNGARAKDWLFTGDEVMMKIDHTAGALREADRRRGRLRRSTSKAQK